MKIDSGKRSGRNSKTDLKPLPFYAGSKTLNFTPIRSPKTSTNFVSSKKLFTVHETTTTSDFRN